MRSFVFKAALAAVLVSTSLAGAYAASPMYPAQTQTGTGNMATAPAAPAVKHTAAKVETNYRPRLTQIVDELGKTNHRMSVDHNRGYLTLAEYRKFEDRSKAIRNAAFQTADNHRGALPKAQYDRLQANIQGLNHDIHRMSVA